MRGMRGDMPCKGPCPEKRIDKSQFQNARFLAKSVSDLNYIPLYFSFIKKKFVIFFLSSSPLCQIPGDGIHFGS